MASVAAFAKANYFLLGMFACVFVAAACPSLGANGGPLKPEVTINKLAVRLMFLISGLSLPLDDLRSAVTNVKANALIQFFVFGFAGLATAFGIAPALTKLGVLNHELINGLIVLACLPTTIGTGVALTNASGGNVAVAIFHAVFSNLAGVVVAPALIFFYLGSDAAAATAADLASGGPAASVSKLAYAVLLPVLVGMMIRASPTFGASVATKPVKARLKLASDAIILSIVYNTFCNTFQSGFGVSGKEVTALALVLCVLLAGYKACVFVAARAAGLAKKRRRRRDVHGFAENARLRFAAHQGALRRITRLGVVLLARAGVPPAADARRLSARPETPGVRGTGGGGRVDRARRPRVGARKAKRNASGDF
jgi:sodium/bile acid cotransporter 7